MEEAMRTKLLATAALTTLALGGIDWGLRPQGRPLPAVSLTGVSSVPGMHLSGASGWSRSRIQIDCWARTFKTARDIAKVIAGAGGVLVGFSGTVVAVRMRTFILASRSRTDSDAIGPIFCQSIDVLVWHAE